MSESIKHGLDHTRIEAIIERRVTGMTFDEYGAPQPVRSTFIIGVGQQLARARLAPLFAAPVPEGAVSRQQVRRQSFKARRAARARALAEVAAEMLKLVRVRRKARVIVHAKELVAQAAGAGA